MVTGKLYILLFLLIFTSSGIYSQVRTVWRIGVSQNYTNYSFPDNPEPLLYKGINPSVEFLEVIIGDYFSFYSGLTYRTNNINFSLSPYGISYLLKRGVVPTEFESNNINVKANVFTMGAPFAISIGNWYGRHIDFGYEIEVPMWYNEVIFNGNTSLNEETYWLYRYLPFAFHNLFVSLQMIRGVQLNLKYYLNDFYPSGSVYNWYNGYRNRFLLRPQYYPDTGPMMSVGLSINLFSTEGWTILRY